MKRGVSSPFAFQLNRRLRRQSTLLCSSTYVFLPDVHNKWRKSWGLLLRSSSRSFTCQAQKKLCYQTRRVPRSKMAHTVPGRRSRYSSPCSKRRTARAGTCSVRHLLPGPFDDLHIRLCQMLKHIQSCISFRQDILCRTC